MVCLDTNIFIYLANRSLAGRILSDTDIGYASVVRIETLGYQGITVSEAKELAQLFDETVQFDLDDSIIARAIDIRQRLRIGLGDAIIAATALEHNCELWTANTADFQDIAGLRIHNPLLA